MRSKRPINDTKVYYLSCSEQGNHNMSSFDSSSPSIFGSNWGSVSSSVQSSSSSNSSSGGGFSALA